MKIAIIGAGWVGCHLGKHLMKEYEVDIYESHKVFNGSSANNQNRLHLGFHYVRNHRTRILCKHTFDRFINEYGKFISDVPFNIYTVSNKSVIDFETYKSVFKYDELDYIEASFDFLNDVEGSIVTNEKQINFVQLSQYFNELLRDNLRYKTINDLSELHNYDLIINCTNNVIKNPSLESFYEVTLSLLYNVVSELEFGALTVVDGNFSSIFPYQHDQYTLTDVEYTPLFSSTNFNEVSRFINSVDQELINNRRSLMEHKISCVYPNFNKNLKYANYFLSLKSKFESKSADRFPILSVVDNVIHCFTGKIQGIYYIQDEIQKYLQK